MNFAKKTVQKITQWSFSRWKCHDECPFRAKLQFIDKLKSPGSPAMARGDRIHKAAEAFVKGDTVKIDPGLKAVSTALRRYKKIGAQPELMLAVTRDWRPTGWFDANVWCRIKVDVLALIKLPKKKTVIEVIDYKTGQYKPGNEDYTKQLSLYAVGGLSVYAVAQEAHTSLLFTDHNKSEPAVYSRDDLPALRREWEERVTPMLEDTLFAPRPGWYCGRCHFRKSNGGPCDY